MERWRRRDAEEEKEEAEDLHVEHERREGA
jgi:hypothetical protein